MKQNHRTLILASQSPRRKELLGLFHLPFLIRPAVGEEESHAEQPADYVRELAYKKAKEVYEAVRAEDEAADPIVIGADTIVVCGDQILGKPKDQMDAHRMISLLQGRTHTVMTGVSMIWKDDEHHVTSSTFCEVTEVHVASMSEEEITAYIQTPIPYDKAGAYGIQSEFGLYISGINGDYNNVVGLPAARLYREMKQQGLL